MNKKYNFDEDIKTYISVSQEIDRLKDLRLNVSRRAAEYMEEKGVDKITTANGRIVHLNYGLPFSIDKLRKRDYTLLKEWCRDNNLVSINYALLVSALKNGNKPPIKAEYTEPDPRIRLGGISKRLKKLL